MPPRIVDTPAWRALVQHAATLRPRHLRQLFAADRRRFERFSLALEGERPGDDLALLFDYSKQRIDDTTMRLLANLAHAAGVRDWIERMFAGEAVNASENRPALHVALRSSAAHWPLPAGDDAMNAVRTGRAQMREFCDAVRAGTLRGYSGEPIRAVVNIGIGGSDLGPRMATAALAAFAHPALRIRYVSNLDAADLAPVLEDLDPRSTLFIVTSKTFTTLETMTNAGSARNWLLAAAGEAADEALARQFVAVTPNAAEALRFGIAPGRLFAFRDWVGGRFS
ncbi:MAG: glucose-6-phosphate isomerase, partial [Azospira sp.]|nr:glucose-6-phosphate isomerase [Azospira sp.]